jgi:hypothetical protein
VLNVTVAQVILDHPGIGSLIRQSVPARMAEHVRVCLQGQAAIWFSLTGLPRFLWWVGGSLRLSPEWFSLGRIRVNAQCVWLWKRKRIRERIRPHVGEPYHHGANLENR